MTRAEVLQKMAEAIGDALGSSAAWREALAHLDEVGLEPRVAIGLHTFVCAHAPGVAPESDGDFLRSLRIAPDLEAR